MRPSPGDPVAAVRGGDEAAFAALVERHRRELHLHCYRMLGSLDEAEELTQETFLRAWRKRATFEGRSSFRAWLYRIATNACLDELARPPRRPVSGEVTWLQPYPDELLDEVPASDEEPDAAVVAKETIELAYVVAIQHLSPRSRAVLILRDALGWSAKATASLLGMSVPAANSALQRARATLKENLPERRLEWSPEADPSAETRHLVDLYVEATERGDAEALVATLSEDARFSMPPEPDLYEGRDTILSAWVEGGFGSEEIGEFRCLVTGANRQPAVACYRRLPGETRYEGLAIDVLRVEAGEITEVIAFGASVFAAFGLPESL